MNLQQAFNFSQDDVIAFTGAGGKTTASFQLARQFKSPVIVTTTTHLGTWQVALADVHLVLEHETNGYFQINSNPELVTLITGPAQPNNRLAAPTFTQMEGIYCYCKANRYPLLIEADGARQKLIKAFNDYEPAVPPFCTKIVHMVGLNGIGKPLSEEIVHRSELFGETSGTRIGAMITPESLVKVLTSQAERLRQLVPEAKRYLLFNQAEGDYLQSVGGRVTSQLVSVFQKVAVSSLLTTDQVTARKHSVAAIILAAGASSRFGRVKQLSPWGGKTLVEAVIHTACQAGLSPIIVVGGNHFKELHNVIQHEAVKIVLNEKWESGLSFSIQAGLNALKAETEGAIFLMADQPQISVNLLKALVDQSYSDAKPIIGPIIDGKRSSPMYFERSTFSELMRLEGDQGGRELIGQFPVTLIDWFDQKMAVDIDLPEDFQKL